jgi:hypothetical protein
MRHPFLSQLRSLLLVSGVVALFGGFLAALWLSYQSAATMIEFQSAFGGSASVGDMIQLRLTTFGTVFAGVVGTFVGMLFLTDAIRWMLNVEDHLYNRRPDVQHTQQIGMIAVDDTQIDAYAPLSPRWYERAGDWLTGLAGAQTPEVQLAEPNLAELAIAPPPALAAVYLNGNTEAEGHEADIAHEPASRRPPEQPEPAGASSAPPFVETDSVPIIGAVLDVSSRAPAPSIQVETFNAVSVPPTAEPVLDPILPEMDPAPEPVAEEVASAPLEPEPEPAMRPLSKQQRLGVTGELRKLPKTGRLGEDSDKADSGPVNKEKQAELHFQRAMKYFKREKYKKAGQHFYQALRLNPEHEKAKQGYERCRELVQQQGESEAM